MVIVFDEGQQFTGEPSAYLYPKGDSLVYCLAIAPQGLDPS
eukprot:CAMPEP_0114018340 /NCGR_PEP_ID=MMETSP0372-20130328/15521_1 /TAXON_ID=340204 /ORGANISM="Lankesteria abbotti" /LENGTH=40 /assembly_acc=CAM_ASM_000359